MCTAALFGNAGNLFLAQLKGWQDSVLHCCKVEVRVLLLALNRQTFPCLNGVPIPLLQPLPPSSKSVGRACRFQEHLPELPSPPLCLLRTHSYTTGLSQLIQRIILFQHSMFLITITYMWFLLIEERGHMWGEFCSGYYKIIILGGKLVECNLFSQVKEFLTEIIQFWLILAFYTDKRKTMHLLMNTI